jgi:hypothetical protein
MAKGDLDGEVENVFTVMPEGVYQGSVNNVSVKTSSKNVNYINVEFKLVNNRRAWDKLWFHTPGGKNTTKGKLEALGFTRDERKQLDPDYLDSIVSAIKAISTGKVYDIKIGIKDGQNEVKYYNDANGDANIDSNTPGETKAPW